MRGSDSNTTQCTGMRQVRPEQYLSRQQGYIAETASGLPGLSRVVAGLSAPPAPSRPIGSRRQREERFRANIPANRGAVPASSLKGSEAVMRMKGESAPLSWSVLVSPCLSCPRRAVLSWYLPGLGGTSPLQRRAYQRMSIPPLASHTWPFAPAPPRDMPTAPPPICDVAAHPSPFHPSHHQTPD